MTSDPSQGLAYRNMRLAPHAYLYERCASPAKCRRRAITFVENLFTSDLHTKGSPFPALDTFSMQGA
ncbi:MAG: hypothetical protein ACRD4H_12485, partial [Candidatus Acidiferrales bacterium]